MKYGLLKGVIMRNLIYLVLFYIIYFPAVIIAHYSRDTICNSWDTFTTICDAIPASTDSALNFILYVVVPLSALLWTIWSASPPTYQQYG